jgi:hypothetical protein
MNPAFPVPARAAVSKQQSPARHSRLPGGNRRIVRKIERLPSQLTEPGPQPKSCRPEQQTDNGQDRWRTAGNATQGQVQVQFLHSLQRLNDPGSRTHPQPGRPKPARHRMQRDSRPSGRSGSINRLSSNRFLPPRREFHQFIDRCVSPQRTAGATVESVTPGAWQRSQVRDPDTGQTENETNHDGALPGIDKNRGVFVCGETNVLWPSWSCHWS